MIVSRTYINIEFINSIFTYGSDVRKLQFPNFWKPLFGNRVQPNTPTHSNAAVPNTPLDFHRIRL